MNTEKIEKLKKGLNNSQISDSIKLKIKAEIEKLEKEDLASSSTPKKKETKPATTVKEPKRTAMVVAKEIREEGENWASAIKRASDIINKDKKKVEKKVKTEIDKLSTFIKNRKELDGLSGKDLVRDAKRNAKQLGKRTTSHSGETSNQYGTFENKVGKVYYENRDNHGDRLTSKHKSGMPFLEGGGDFMSGVYADGGEVGKEKRFEIDFYDHKGDKEASLDKVLKAVSLSDIIERAKKTAKAEDFKYVEIYHKEHYLGCMSLEKGFDFVQGNGYIDYMLNYETPISFENKEGVRVQSAYIPKNQKTKSEWLGNTTQSREAIAFGEGGDFMNGVYAKGGEIAFGNSNLYLVGKGMDSNGNKIVKLQFPNQRAFSIQTLGNLPKTHRILSGVKNIDDISLSDAEFIEKEAIEYISEFGSDQQKKSLKSFKRFEHGGENIIDLIPLELEPLSTQLSRYTGDSLSQSDYESEDGKNYSTAPDSIIVHKGSGKKFRSPAKIYDHVDGYNLVIRKNGKSIVVYETNEKVADIDDDTLDFSSKDKNVSIDRAKVTKEFYQNNIPNIENATDFYKKVENELLGKYAIYEDYEDAETEEDLKKKKKISDRIKELESLQHRLERKYEGGGSLKDKVVIGETSSGKKVYDDVFATDKIYKDFTSQDHLDASNLYMKTELSDLNMTQRDENSADHYRQTDGYRKELLERRKMRASQKLDLGGTFIVDAKGTPPLQGVVDMHYTGLVGETPAMSIGELFASGGKVKSKIDIIREKSLEILSPKQISIDDITYFKESEEISITFRSYNKKINVDGLHIGYDEKTNMYDVEELQAGQKEEDIYIYKKTPSLTLALKEVLKGNNRKPIKIIKMGFEKGGRVTFKEKSTAIAKNLEGKKVSDKYQKEYGKVYSKKEAEEASKKIAGKMVANEKREPRKNNTRMQKAVAYAKANRKEGQSWREAMKEGFEQAE